MKHRKSIPHRPARTATFNVSRFERSGYELEVWDFNLGAGAGFVMRRHHYANSKVEKFLMLITQFHKCHVGILMLTESSLRP